MPDAQDQPKIDILLRLRMQRRRHTDIAKLFELLTEAIQEIEALRVKVQVLQERLQNGDPVGAVRERPKRGQ